MIDMMLAGVIGGAFGYALALWVIRPDLLMDDVHCEHCHCDYD